MTPRAWMWLALAAGPAEIELEELRAHVAALTAPETAGRATGSRGAAHAANYIAAELTAQGWLPLDGEHRWEFECPAEVPADAGCALALETHGGRLELELGRDFWPLVGAPGTAVGEARLASADQQPRRARFRDRVAILTWELADEGAETDVERDLYRRLERLRMARAAGALVRVSDDLFEYRDRWAQWVAAREPQRRSRIPALVVRAGALPPDAELTGIRVSLSSATRSGTLRGTNVLGWRPAAGADPNAPPAELLVIGAHYDHLGLDPRGRVATGADDNASGVAALLEIADELRHADLSRAVLVVAFSGEEQGLVGSRALAAELQRRGHGVAAMLNMDMIGRGATDAVAVLGARGEPELGELVSRVRGEVDPELRLDIARDSGLFRRSDHYAFHELGVPSLFFFEGLPIRSNNDYHTWRDTMQSVDFHKIQRTARFVSAVAARLAGDHP